MPGEVSVTGVDNIKTCEYAPVPLTTMGVPTAEMGRAAVEMVIRQIEAGGQHEPETVNLQAELTVRDSTAPVKEAASTE